MKNAGWFLLFVCLGCASHTPKADVTISLTDNNRSLRISGFDKAIIADISRDSANEAWQSLLPVYKMPGDTDMKDYQNAQPGNYKVVNNVIVFTPDTAFQKDRSYFVRYYRYDDIKDAWQFVRQKRRTGTLSYKDLLFRY